MSGKIYIGGLPDDASSQELEDAFKRFGRIRKVWVARRPPGFAFIEFDDARDAEDAVRDMDGARVCGVRAKVELSNQGARGGGGGRGGGRRDDRGGFGGGRMDFGRDRDRDYGRDRDRDYGRGGGGGQNRNGGGRYPRSRSRSPYQRDADGGRRSRSRSSRGSPRVDGNNGGSPRDARSRSRS